MYPSIISVTPQKDFTLVVVFDNGQSRILDMNPFLDFGIFRRIKDEDAFSNVHVAFDTIEWACGADLDPEFVFNRSVPA